MNVTHECDTLAIVIWREGDRYRREVTYLAGDPVMSGTVTRTASRVLSDVGHCGGCGWVYRPVKRQTHLSRAKAEYDLAVIQWEQDRERELRGHLHDTPERGESLPLSEQRFREAFPKPVWRDYVRNVGVHGERVA